MNQTILHVHFNYTMPTAEFEGLCTHAAPAIAGVEGLQWKIFLLDEKHQAAGGQYLFLNPAAAQAYLEGPIIAQLRQHPGIKNLTARQFDIQESPTKVTRGPLDAPASRPSMTTTGA
jgi:hypothetical protein